MSETIAVTGATGFIGRHLVNCLLTDGYEVRALARRQNDGLPASVEVIHGSVEDETAVEALIDGADAVVHCAGLIKGAGKDRLREVNVGGTAALARVCARQKAPPRVVFLSSLAARHPELSDYAASKHDAEAELASHGGDLDWSVLRPPAVYGPGDKETYQLLKFVSRGYFLVPDLDGSRISLIYVSDLCDAIVALLREPPPAGTVIDIRDPCEDGYSWKSVASACERYLGRRITCIQVPKAALDALAAANVAVGRITGRPPMLTPGKVRELYHRNWVCRDNALTRCTSWRPRVPLERGIPLTIAWYRDNGWL